MGQRFVNKFQFNNQPIALANSDISFSRFRDGPYLSAPVVIASLSAPQMRFVRAEKSTVMPLNLIRMIPGIASTQTVDAFAVAGQSPPLNTVCDGLVPLAIVPQGPGGTLAQYTPGAFQSFDFAPDLGSVASPGSFTFLIIDFLEGGPDPLLETNTRGCMALNSPFSLQPVTDPNVISSRLNDRFVQDGNTTPYPVGDGPNQYQQYVGAGGTGQRRLVVPFVSATQGAWAPFSIGSVSPVYVLNYGCFFLREMSAGGEIRGEFIGQCQVNGYFDPAAPIPPGLGLPNITKLVLHH